MSDEDSKVVANWLYNQLNDITGGPNFVNPTQKDIQEDFEAKMGDFMGSLEKMTEGLEVRGPNGEKLT